MSNTITPALQEINKLTDKWEASFKSIDKIAVDIATKMAKISKTDSSGLASSEVTERLVANSNAVKLLNEQLEKQKQINKQLKDSLDKLAQKRSKNNQLTVQERVDKSIALRNDKTEARTKSVLAGAYERLSAKLIILRGKYKNLEIRRQQGEKLTAKEITQLQRLEKQVTRTRIALEKTDKRAGQSQRRVGSYADALKGATAQAMNLARAMGFVGGAFLVVNSIREAIKTTREYNLTMQTLAGVLRKDREEIAGLEEEIQKVGATTVRTTTETAQLAESLATLGKTPDEIQKLLRPITDLSVGLKAGSDVSGEFLVKMLNTFGASADEAEAYADTIATIRTSTSLDFQQMVDSFQYLAPISKVLNKDLAYTGALIGILADNGIKAERAGRLMGTAQQKLAKEGKTLADALEEVNKAQADGATELELLALTSNLFGKQASALGVILANNSDIIDTNAQAIRDNGGALEELVDKQLDSLDGSLKLLKSAWEGYILEVDEASGASNGLRGAVDFLTKNLKTIIETIVLGVKIWAGYKVAVFLARVQSSLMAKQALYTRFAMIKMAQGVKTSTLSWKAFNTVLKANALGIAVTAIIALISIYKKLNVSLEDSIKATNKATKAHQNASSAQREQADELKKMSERYEVLTSKTSLNESEQKELDKIVKQIAKSVPEAVTEIDKYGNALKINTKEVDKFTTANEKLNQEIDKRLLEENTDQIGALENKYKNLNSILNETNKKRKEAIYVGTEIGKIGILLGKVTVNNTTATTDQLIQLRSILGVTQKQIDEKKRFIETLTAEGRERIRLRQEAEAKAKADAKALLESQALSGELKDQSLTVSDLKDKVKALKDEQEELTSQDGERAKEIKALIKAYEDEINAILLNTKATENQNEWLIKTISNRSKEYTVEQLSKKSKEELLEILSKINKKKDEENEKTEKQVSLLKEWIESIKEINRLRKERFDSGVSFGEQSLSNDPFLEGLVVPSDEETLNALNDALEKTKQRLDAIKGSQDDLLKKETLLDALGGLEQTLQIQSGTFEKLFNQIESGFDDAGESARAFGEIAKGAFATITQASNQRAENELRNLEIEKETALQFAGDSVLAKEQIEQEYDDKQKAIRRKQAEQDRNIALFNIAVDTASGIVNAASKVATIPLIPFIAGIGLAQAAVIASAPLPEFKDGHLEGTYEGFAKINDEKSPLYREIVARKDGSIDMYKKRDQIIHMNKGDKVLPAKMSDGIIQDMKLRGVLDNLNISMSKQTVNSISKSDLREVMNQTLAKQPQMFANFDKDGIITGYRKGHTLTILKDNSVRFK